MMVSGLASALGAGFASGLDSGLACTWGRPCASHNTPLPTALPGDSLSEFPMLGNAVTPRGVTNCHFITAEHAEGAERKVHRAPC